MKYISRFFLTVVVMFTAACSSTSVISSWKNDQTSQQPLDKILVVGIHKEAGMRAEYETRFANKLKSIGINAVAAASIPELARERTKNQVMSLAQNNDFDGILVTKYNALKHEQIYQPGFTDYQIIGYRGYFDPFYSTGIMEIEHPGYTIDREVLYLEVSLFETDQWQIMWRAMTATNDPYKSDVITDVVNSLSQEIKRADLF